MKRYEIVNPSDYYEMEAISREVAACAVFLLGEGKYALRPLDGTDHETTRVPIFIFGGATEWYQREFGRSLDEGLTELRAEVAAALSTVKMRKGHKSSSLNDIGGYAAHLASHLGKKISKHARPQTGGEKP